MVARAADRRRAEAAKVQAGPGFEGMRELVEDDVEDPYGLFDRIRVTRNARHDPIEQLWNQRRRDGSRVIAMGERLAGQKVRALVEAAGLDSVKAVLYERVPVDGGGRRDGLADSRIDAADRLLKLARFIGRDQFILLVNVAGYGQTITLAAADLEDDPDGAVNGGCSARAKDRAGWMLRRALSNAADMFGYGAARGPERGSMRVVMRGDRPGIADVEESGRLVAEAIEARERRKERRARKKAGAGRRKAARPAGGGQGPG